MSTQPEISQRDLRMRSKEIMDRLEAGERFTVTRDGHQIGELVPLRRPRREVPREELLAAFRGLPALNAARFRSDLDAGVDPWVHPTNDTDL